MKTIYTLLALLLLLSACGRTPIKVGKIDDSKMVDWKEFRDLGLEKAAEKYLGKVITFTDLYTIGLSAKNEERGNACLIYYQPMETYNWKSLPYLEKKSNPDIWKKGPTGLDAAHFGVYFNYGAEVVEWTERDKFRLTEVDELEIVRLDDYNFCTMCKWDPEDPEKCKESSPQMKVTGRVISLYESSNSIRLLVIPLGFEY